jgi:hypothetical protein
MNQADFVFESTFRTIMKDGDLFAQKQAEELAARAIQLWTKGKPYKDVLNIVMKEAKELIKLNKAAKKVQAA